MPKTTQSVQYASQLLAAAKFSDRINDPRQIGGAVQTALVKVIMDATNVAADVITLLELPPGAVVLPEMCQIFVTDDMTTGALTIHVGDVVSPQRYCISANCAAPGVVPFIAAAATVFPAALATRHQCDPALATTLITATMATFTASIEAGEFYVLLAFKCL